MCPKLFEIDILKGNHVPHYLMIVEPPYLEDCGWETIGVSPSLCNSRSSGSKWAAWLWADHRTFQSHSLSMSKMGIKIRCCEAWARQYIVISIVLRILPQEILPLIIHKILLGLNEILYKALNYLFAYKRHFLTIGAASLKEKII